MSNVIGGILVGGSIIATSASPITIAVNDSVTVIPDVGDKRSALLAKLGIQTIEDLLLHFPRAYQDRRQFTSVVDVEEGANVTLLVEVVTARNLRLRRRQSMAVAQLRDETGELNATWFGRGYLARQLTPGTRLILSGKAGTYKGLALRNPEYEIVSDDEDDLIHTGRIVPLYRLSEGLSQRRLRRWVATALAGPASDLEECLPGGVMERYRYPRLSEAVRTIHFPEDFEAITRARERFAYQELLGLQLRIRRNRQAAATRAGGIRHRTDGPSLASLRTSIPYRLTAAQERVIAEILDEMRAPRPMRRLLQGDVGSGKTLVAAHAVAAAADGEHQTAFMAPTEILAEQHARTLRHWLADTGLRVELLTGSTAGAAARARVALGEADVVVGTHALIENATRFSRLGLVIIDEQHRFGILQRARLLKKGTEPDLLQMTATPIPRSVALTLYGSMDLSIIDELPPGRKPIETALVPAKKRAGLYRKILDEVRKGRQAYIVCPLVDDGKDSELTGVVSLFERLSQGPLRDVNCALLHGRLPSEEKDLVMREFKEGRLQVLIATTVIEVGIDVPNATMVVIEDAQRFGLSQLHQLRGRVGRGGEASQCFLLGNPSNEDARKRLDLFCNIEDGFRLADEDFKLRGPGELFGLRQAGLSDLRAADLATDMELLLRARRDAEALDDSVADLASDKCLRLVSTRAS